MLNDAGNQYETCHEAHYNRVPESSRHRDQSLSFGISGLRCRCYKRRGTHAGFVREKTAGQSVSACSRQSGSGNSSADRGRIGRIEKDDLQRLSHNIGIHYEDHDAAYDVERRHKRNDRLGCLCNGLNAAYDYQSDKNAHDQAGNIRYVFNEGGIAGHMLLHDGNDCIGRNSTSYTESACRSEKREQNAEPLKLKTSVESIHRTSQHGSVFTFYTELYCDQSLGILGGHSEDAGKPHPKNSTGTSQDNGCSDSYYVSRSDRR